MIDGYEGDKTELGNAEKYFMAISKIPLVELRVNSLEYKSTFDANSKDILQSVNVLVAAIKILKNDKRFQQLLEVVLALGNYLNGSTKLGQTHGFKLQSLAKLADVRSPKNPTVTLINFLADFLPKDYPALFQSLREFSPIHEAARESTTEITKQITELQAGYTKIKQHLESQSCDVTYSTVMRSWAQNAQKLIEDLTQKKDVIINGYKEVVVMFAESNTTKSEDFFGLLSGFISSIEQAHIVNEKRRAEAAKTKGEYDRILKNIKTGEAVTGKIK